MRARTACLALLAVAAVLPLAVSAPARAGGPGVRITAAPSLSPGFARGISDYVVRCDSGTPVRFDVAAPPGTTVRVGDRGSPRSGTFTAEVPLAPGQSTDVVVRHGASHGHRHHVRCVPPDLERWKFHRYARGAAQWYLFAPVDHGSDGESRSHYVILVDGRGTPVWWKRAAAIPFNSTLLPDGRLAWGRWYEMPFGWDSAGGWEIHRLDGTLDRIVRTVGTPTDMHDMEPLPNGNFLAISYRLRSHVDLRPYVDDADGTVWDGEVQEISKTGAVVRSWSTKDHIGLSETRHWDLGEHPVLGKNIYDVFHLNSVEPDGKALIVSGRHVDGVYKIDRVTGRVLWKLGGTKRAESLRVIGDDQSDVLVAQHDARLLPDGTLTVYDNNRGNGPPRAVRFRIDEAKRTATVIEQVPAPYPALVSAAEGSARRLPGGHWVISWGATRLLSEVTSDGRPVWRLELSHPQNFRVTPVAYGRLRPYRLRRAMNHMAAPAAAK